MQLPAVKSAYTPLIAGDVLIYTPEIEERVIEKLETQGVPNPSDTLIRGLITECAHNIAFEKAGIEYTTAILAASYDRIVGGCMQDDKCALWSVRRDGSEQLAKTHTFSKEENYRWSKSPNDVMIPSFTQVASGSGDSIFHGVISYRKLVGRGMIHQSKHTRDELYFFRESALRWCLAT